MRCAAAGFTTWVVSVCIEENVVGTIGGRLCLALDLLLI